MTVPISKRAFEQLRSLFEEASGIRLADEKCSLVEARLRRRLTALQLPSFDDYCRLLRMDPSGEERQLAVDLLTTNETYFFREAEHFEQLGSAVVERFKARKVRLWSTACSSGEEPYSMAMTLLDRRPERNWELSASDLSRTMLARAIRAVFPLQRIDAIPPAYLKRFCMRGTGDYEGMLRVTEEVRNAVRFFEHNLLHDPRLLGPFEIVFIRNVLIYFDEALKRRILEHVIGRLVPGGLLFLGHAEPLQMRDLPLQRIGRALFEKC